MQANVAVAALLLCILTFFGEVGAQTIPGDVTFEVPINLTRLSPSLSKVAVTCALGLTSDPTRLIHSMDTTYSKEGDVFFNRVELPVSAGQVVTTARVVIAVPSFAMFKPGAVLNYQCALSAMS